MKIEILLAAYNGERFIAEQILSILDQEGEDFGILVADDGSEDNTRERIEGLIGQYPGRIRLLERKKKASGAAENFFDLLEHAEAEYLMFADQDDVWKKDKLEKTWKRMRQMERKYGKSEPILIHSDLMLADGDLKITRESMHSFMRMKAHCKDLRHLLVENNITGNTVMINKAMQRAFIRPRHFVMHDWWLGLMAASFGKISYIDEALVIYRQHGKNLLGAKNAYSWEEIKKRLSGKKEVRENYRKIFAQARELISLHRERMKEEEIGKIEAFLQMEGLSRRGKIKSILKHKFFKSSVLMTIGEMLNI